MKNNQGYHPLYFLFWICLCCFINEAHAMEQTSTTTTTTTTSNTAVLNIIPSFVVNIPAYVPADDESDSDSDVDEELIKKNKYTNDLYVKQSPFMMSQEKRGRVFDYSSKKSTKKELIEPELNCISSVKVKTSDKNKQSITQTILNKLKSEAFKDSPDEKLSHLSLMVCLNRPKSLSSKKNCCLKRELEKPVEPSPVMTKQVGIFWFPVWQRTNNVSFDERQKPNPPTFEEVLCYYHFLKKYDKGHNTHFASEFRKNNEKIERQIVPYRSLREYTKLMSAQNVKNMRENYPKNPVYLVCCDCDTINFNHCFETFSDVVTSHTNLVDVITTGYDFYVPDNKPQMFALAAKLDMAVRSATARYIPMGVYYPEPALSILVPEKCETVPESFEREKSRSIEVDYDAPQESPIMLSNILKNRMTTQYIPNFVFNFKNALVTMMPERAMQQKVKIKSGKNKGKHNDLKFSAEINKDHKFVNWTMQDLTNITKNFAQSHAHPRSWAQNVLNAFETYGKDDCEKGCGFEISIGSKEKKEKYEIKKRIGNVVREITISLLSRLFKCYDPISLAKDEGDLADILQNYNTRVQDLGSDEIQPYSKKRESNREIWEKIDNITSKKELKSVLCQILKNVDVEQIDKAAKLAGESIRDMLMMHLSLSEKK